MSDEKHQVMKYIVNEFRVAMRGPYSGKLTWYIDWCLFGITQRVTGVTGIIMGYLTTYEHKQNGCFGCGNKGIVTLNGVQEGGHERTPCIKEGCGGYTYECAPSWDVYFKGLCRDCELCDDMV